MMKCKLGDLFEIQQGYAFKSEKYIDNSPYLLCTLGNIGEDNHFKYVDDGKKSYYPDDFPHEYILEEGDLIIPLTEQVIGLLGNTAFVPHTEGYQFVLNQRVGRIYPYQGKADKYYLHYLLKSNLVKKQIEATASATKQRNTSPDKVYDVDVWVPAYDEQIKIGKFMYLLEQKYNVNQNINDELFSIAKGIFDYWFLQYNFPDENGMPYKNNKGDMVYCKELDMDIPCDWKVGSLYKIADFINGLACQKYRPAEGEPFLPVIKITEMHDGITDATEHVSINIPEDKMIFDGDILFSWSASLETMFWYGGPAGLNQHIFKVVPLTGYSFYTFMQLNAYISNFRRIAQSRKTTMGHITAEHLHHSKIAIPPIELIKKYDEKVAVIFQQIKKNNAENLYLMNLEDYLLPLIINGQVKFNRMKDKDEV
ncbi:restriction endonuclease subunit S [Succinimonas sp.]|uniref:restriction endonuclease subunit S n=1 Tax=Succinimonas sp. TaxID=1936151 RepID=UPI0038642E97